MSFPQDLETMPTQTVVSKTWMEERGFVMEDPSAQWEREEFERREREDYEVTEKARIQHYEQMHRFEQLKRSNEQ